MCAVDCFIAARVAGGPWWSVLSRAGGCGLSVAVIVPEGASRGPPRGHWWTVLSQTDGCGLFCLNQGAPCGHWWTAVLSQMYLVFKKTKTRSDAGTSNVTNKHGSDRSSTRVIQSWSRAELIPRKSRRHQAGARSLAGKCPHRRDNW